LDRFLFAFEMSGFAIALIGLQKDFWLKLKRRKFS
tara:strand:+ start:1460 stop:1564 length:105 start_codon:yes stop_codon:yes gene_type:complete